MKNKLIALSVFMLVAVWVVNGQYVYKPLRLDIGAGVAIFEGNENYTVRSSEGRDIEY